MRSSTVLVLSLHGVAHELIKNIVLAGIGRLIVADGEKVTEEDLGSGFLFQEEAGAVGTEVSGAVAQKLFQALTLSAHSSRPPTNRLPQPTRVAHRATFPRTLRHRGRQ